VHPDRSDLSRYCDGRLDAAKAELISAHIEECEFCRELCSEFRALSGFVDEAIRQSRPESVDSAAGGVYSQATSGLRIRLVPSIPVGRPEQALLAADGTSAAAPRLESIGTLYSQSPEVVLRIMRDNARGQEYVQLVADDEKLIARVLVQVPELGVNVLTDLDGRGEIEWQRADDPAKYAWRVKLPDAELSLAPLEYDPERVEYQEETVLETARGDRIGVRFEGKVEGKRLTLRILQLGGRADFGTVHVAVAQAGETITAPLSGKDELHLTLRSPDDLIAIRLFAE